jgi:hypothetical protein
MKRTMLYDQYKYLADVDLATLNVGAGTIEVLDESTQKMIPHKLNGAVVSMIKYAYERGLKHQPLY